MYSPGSAYSKEFVTSNPTTGAAVNADSLPVATADFDGTGTGSMALTVANVSAGLYKITGTVPATRVPGDVLNVSVAATVAAVAGKSVVETAVIEAVRMSLPVGVVTAVTTSPAITITATMAGLGAGIANDDLIGRRLVVNAGTAQGFETDGLSDFALTGTTAVFTFAATQRRMPSAGDLVVVGGF